MGQPEHDREAGAGSEDVAPETAADPPPPPRPLIVWTADATGRVEDMPMWREYTGQSPAEVRGWGWLDAVHPDDRERTAGFWARAVKAGSLYEVEYRVRRRDGLYRPFAVRGVPVIGDDGAVREWVGACTDISDRKESEAALQRQAEEMALLYEAGGLLGRTLDPEVVYDTLHGLVARAMDCDTLLVSSYNPDDNLIRCTYAWIEGRRVDAAEFPPIPLAPQGRGLQSRVIRTGESLRVGDVPGETAALRAVHYVSADGTVDDQPSADPMETRSIVMVPIRLEGRVLGVAQVMSHRADAYTDGHLRILEALMSQVAAAGRNAYLYQQARAEIAERRRAEAERERALEENARLLRQTEEAARQQRRFLREMLVGMTEGRLRLCDSAEDLPVPLAPAAAAPIALSGPTLRQFRAEVERVALQQGLPDERWYDLLSGAGEASMNAVVHAGGGEARLHAGPDGVVQIWIEDRGKGIAEETLHRATLERGYTTAGTLGHGFWMMLQTCDRIWLLTGPTGTTVVLEQGREAPEPYWLRERPPLALEIEGLDEIEGLGDLIERLSG
jgi:PAS domain S-box-containing protein